MDNAFERARAAYGSGAYDDATLEFLFPQLKESEDERIRKHLIEVVELYWGTTNEPGKAEDLAWLEKQKEASKATEAVERIDKYIDEHLANAHDMKDSNPDKKYYRGWDDALGKMSGILQDVYSGEKKKDHFRDDTKMVEQKPAEWSEEDEKKIAELKNLIAQCNGFNKENRKKAFDMIDALRPHNAKKYSGPKPSWKPREEELVALKRVGSILRDYGYGELAKMVFMIEGKLANLAVLNKSIWKPSEEQMGALSWMLENARGNIDFDSLKDLYKQLKKLM